MRDLKVISDGRTGRLRRSSDFSAIRSGLFRAAEANDGYELAHHLLYAPHVVRPTADDLAWLVEEARPETWAALNAAVTRKERFVSAVFNWVLLAKNDEGAFLDQVAAWGHCPLDPYLISRYYSDQRYVPAGRLDPDKSYPEYFRENATVADLVEFGRGFNLETVGEWFDVDVRPLEAELLAPIGTDVATVRSVTQAELADEMAGRALGGTGCFMPRAKKYRGGPFEKLTGNLPVYVLRVARAETDFPVGYQVLSSTYQRVHWIGVDRREDAARMKRSVGSRMGYHLRRQIGALMDEIAGDDSSLKPGDHPF